MHYEKLFEKGTIGRLELRNRVVMTAMGTMLGDWNGCSTLEQVTEELARLAQSGDMIITVGAGDIYRAGEMLLNWGDAE